MANESSAVPAARSDAGAVERSRPVPVFTPATDIDETKDALIVRADVPGADPGSLSVSLDRDVLRITAQAKPQRPDGFGLVHAEYRPGDYERSFVLAVDVDPDKIDARVKDGVLTISLPKAQPAPARRITVKAA